MNIMDYNDFDYLRNSPFKARTFRILPLSRVGHSQYNTKESYSHKYLKSLDHLRIKESQIVQEKLKESTEIPSKNIEIVNESISPIRDELSNNNTFNKASSKKFKTLMSNSSSNFHKTTNSFNSTFSSKNYFNLTGIKNFKRNNNKGNPDEKYKENHEENYQNLTKSVKDFFKMKSTSLVNGFRADEIPHLVSSPRSPCSIEFMKRIEKTLPKLKNEDEENRKFNNILKTIKKYESTSKYPNLKNILNQGEIKNIQILLGNNKTMGEKYNPLNFYHCLSKTNKRRNLYGAVFEH